MNKVILITGIGGDISQGVATILRENRPDLRLIGVDIHSQHGGHLFVDQFALVPKASAPDYMDTLKAIVRKYSVDIVIPMSEPELAVTRPFLELGPGGKMDYCWRSGCRGGSGQARNDAFPGRARRTSALGPNPWVMVVQFLTPAS